MKSNERAGFKLANQSVDIDSINLYSRWKAKKGRVLNYPIKAWKSIHINSIVRWITRKNGRSTDAKDHWLSEDTPKTQNWTDTLTIPFTFANVDLLKFKKNHILSILTHAHKKFTFFLFCKKQFFFQKKKYFCNRKMKNKFNYLKKQNSFIFKINQ